MTSFIGECVAATPRPELRAYRFFIAWNGVLTLAMRGHTSGVMKMKQRVTQEYGFRDENPGSRWPKITFGVLQDDDCVLTIDELVTLKRVCEQFEAVIDTSGWRFRPTMASVVFYQHRSLHRIITQNDYPFNSECWERTEDEASMANVDAVMEEVAPSADVEKLAAYLPRVNAPGNRVHHYCVDNAHGNTMVMMVGGRDNNIPDFLIDFQHAVDAALPNHYVWLPLDGLHVTLRALQ